MDCCDLPSTALCPLTLLPILGETRLSLSPRVPKRGLGLLRGGDGSGSTKSP